MREMSAEMASLLKSKNMVGANAPSWEVAVGGGGSDPVFDDPITYVLQGANTTLSNWVPIDGGMQMAAYIDNDKNIILAYTTGEKHLTTDYPIESTLDSGLDVRETLSLVLLKRNDNKVLMIVDDGYKDPGIGQTLEAYITEDYSTFTLYSTIYAPSGSSGTRYLAAALPLPLYEDGIITLVSQGYYNDSPPSGVFVFRSTDNGLNWSTVATLYAGSIFPAQGVYSPAKVSDGYVFTTRRTTDYNILVRSTDGISWNTTLWTPPDSTGQPMSFYNHNGTLFAITTGINGNYGVYVMENPTMEKVRTNDGWTKGAVCVTSTYAPHRISEMPSGALAVLFNYAISREFKIDFTPNSFQGVKSISINRDKNIAGQLNLAIDNKDGVNSVDVSGVLLPNVEVVVKQGYGEEKVTTFTGLIDRVEMRTFPQEVLVTCRDKIKLALDQIITLVDGENVSRVVTYTEQTVEAIFSDLCTKAGLSTGTVETTGVTLSEKTFSWETYGDAFQWLADLVGFEFTADEDGLVHFRADEAPTTPTVAYIFKEGEDIVNLGYVVDDNELYYDIYVYGAEVDGTVVYGYSPYYGRTNYNVLEQKILKIDAPDCDTYLKCQEIANRTAKLMASRARVVTFQAIGIPWLQIGDFIQVIESSTTISEIYRITGLQTNMDENGYTMTITCYYHSYGEVEE